MSFSHRAANTSLQQARIDCMNVIQKEEMNELTFATNIIKYLSLIQLLQIDNPLFRSEAKDTYYDMLEYCKLNSKYLKQNFDTVSILVRSSCNPIKYKWFEYVKKDEEMEEVEQQLKAMGI